MCVGRSGHAWHLGSDRGLTSDSQNSDGITPCTSMLHLDVGDVLSL
jgi:hypothetical protein